jgi:hypothetical protein
MNYDAISEIFYPNWGTGIADTVTVELYDDSYGNIIARFPGVYLHTDGILTIQNITECLNDYYYITIYHRNSVPMTSAIPQSFAGNNISYDFTFPAGQAYGTGLAPQKNLGGGFYGMYCGELDQDDYYSIDGFDLSLLEVELVAGPYGYLETDLNGDGVIDGFDLIIMEPNIVLNPLFWNPQIAKKYQITSQKKLFETKMSNMWAK